MNNIPSPLPKTSDDWLEHDIKAAGADVAPRVTPADIEANIASEHYFTAAEAIDGAAAPVAFEFYNPATGHAIVDYSEHTYVGLLSREKGYVPLPLVKKSIVAATPLALLTFCVLVLRNGFTVTGESACASPENFNAEIGRKIARENAVSKVWALMGYALKERLEGLQAGDVTDAKASGFREGYASAMRGDPAPISNGSDDFALPAKACDLSGEGVCEACQ